MSPFLELGNCGRGPMDVLCPTTHSWDFQVLSNGRFTYSDISTEWGGFSDDDDKSKQNMHRQLHVGYEMTVQQITSTLRDDNGLSDTTTTGVVSPQSIEPRLSWQGRSWWRKWYQSCTIFDLHVSGGGPKEHNGLDILYGLGPGTTRTSRHCSDTIGFGSDCDAMLIEYGSCNTGDYGSGGSTPFDDLNPTIFEAATTSLLIISRWSYSPSKNGVSRVEKEHSNIQNGLVNGLFGKLWKPQHTVNVYAREHAARKQLFVNKIPREKGNAFISEFRNHLRM